MNHRELLERIEILSREEARKRHDLAAGFSELKRQMVPVEIVKRAIKSRMVKIKSFFSHFSSRPKPSHG